MIQEIIKGLSEMETNALIEVLCLACVAGMVFALAFVAFIFDQLGRRSRKKQSIK